MSRRIHLVAAAALAAALLSPSGADAQIGSLTKKAKKQAEAAVGITDSSADKSKQSGAAGATASSASGASSSTKSPYNDYVLELNGEVLDRFQKSLAAASSSRAELMKDVPTPQARQACLSKPPAPEEKAQLDSGLAAMDKQQNLPEYQRHMNKMLELQAKRCGKDPNDSELQKALYEQPKSAALKAGGFTEGQYAMIKERVHPFCALPPDKNGPKVQGSGSSLFYVYSDVEVQALRARCDKLVPALKAEL